MERFNTIIPDGADRIMKMAEKQIEHRQVLEKAVILAGVKSEPRGQVLGFILYAMLIVSGTVLILYDKSTAGLTTLLGGSAVFVGLFIASRKSKQKELAKKRDE